MRTTSLLTVVLAAAFAMSACRKRSTPPPAPSAESAPAAPAETPAPTAAPPAASPVQPAQASAAPAGQANYMPGNTAYDDLNKHLSWFVISKKRFPASVDELLTANRLPKPVLPPGGQLVINQKTKTVDYVGPK